MIDIAVKDVLVPLATVVTGIITGLIAGERKIRADRAADRARRRADVQRAELEEASKLLHKYLTLRPTREMLQGLLDQTPSGRSPSGLPVMQAELRNTAMSLQILLPDKGDALVVDRDHRVVFDWVRQTWKALDEGTATAAAPDDRPLIDLARHLREAISLTDSPADAAPSRRWLRIRRSARH